MLEDDDDGWSRCFFCVPPLFLATLSVLPTFAAGVLPPSVPLLPLFPCREEDAEVAFDLGGIVACCDKRRRPRM